MADNFFKVKNGLNLPTASADPTVTPPAANSAAGDMVFYNGKLYIYNGIAWGVKPGSGSTGLIVNADVDNGAAIDGTKISPNFGSQNVTTSGTISTTGASGITSAGVLTTNTKLSVNANTASEAVYIQQLGAGNALVIEDSANPDTTSLVVDASGNLGVGVNPASSLTEKLTVTGDVKVSTGDIKLDTAKGIESSTAASTLNIGTGSNTTTLNLGTGSSTQTVNIGTGAGVTTINIGATGDTVVVAGTLTTVNTTNLDVADKNITLNKGGLAGSANGSGINIEAGGSSVASLSFDQTDGGAQPQNTFTLSGTGSLALPAGTTAQRPNTPTSGMVRYNNTDNVFEGYNGLSGWGVIGGATTVKRITQATSFDVGDVLYLNGSIYTKALATTAAAAEVCAVVSKVLTVGSVYEITIAGEVTGLLAANFDENVLPAVGENVFLSPTNSGKLTITEPSVVGQINKPVGIISDSGKLFVDIKRGAVVGGANVRTQITLGNATTTNVQNASAYEAGELAGWVFIDGTTDYRFFVRAQFARNGLGNDYNLSYQTTGDTPPAGFSMGITAAGVITATLPSIGGYATASINFALNAPAVGATLPLQVASTNVSFSDIQAASSAGITFKEDGGTTTGSVSDAGAWTFPSATTHTFGSNSAITSCNIALKGQTTGTGGSIQLHRQNVGHWGIYLDNSGPGGNNGLGFYNDPNAIYTGGCSPTGAWTLGSSSGTATVSHQIYAVNNPAGTAAVHFRKPAVAINSGGNSYLEFYGSSGGYDGYLGVSGTTLQVVDASDSRKKENIRPANYGLKEINALNPVVYDWKEEFGGEKNIKGFLAQEVKIVLPECVTIKDETDAGGFEDAHYLGTANIIPVLVAAIQELSAKNDALEARLAALESK